MDGNDSLLAKKIVEKWKKKIIKQEKNQIYCKPDFKKLPDMFQK